MAKTDERTRVWTCVVYPDSAPENWRDVLLDLHVSGCISPLHEFDCNPDGELKKPHWHVLLSFDGKKSFEQVKNMLAPLNCPIPQRVESIRGMVRYFLHRDNPEKYQYHISGMVGLAGFDFETYFEYAAVERRKALKDMRKTILEKHFTEFCDFMEFCDANNPAWSDLLDTNSSYVISLYITSLRNKDKEARAKL